MSKYWRVIGHYNGEAQTYEALAGAFQTSPYTPDETARLIGLRIIPSAEAATSLTEGFQIRLSCTTFKPNTMHVAGSGTGLQTVPCASQGHIDFEVDQKVEAGVPITIEARHAVATAVTANIIIMGLFSN
jgi:hypothetical protein